MPTPYFDPAVPGGQYFDASGAAVDPQRVLDAMNARIEYSKITADAFKEALQAGRMTVAEFQVSMRWEIKKLTSEMAMLGAGGRENMTFSAWGSVGRALRDSYNFLDGLAAEIAAAPENMAAIIRNRPDMYMNSTRQSYYNAQNAVTAKTGKQAESMRELHGDHSCQPCQELAAMGWRPLGELPPPGGLPCLGMTACRCSMSFRFVDAA